MSKKLFIFLFLSFLVGSSVAHAQQDNSTGFIEESFEAKVVNVLDEKQVIREDGTKSTLQKLKLEGLNGNWEGKEIIFDGIGRDTDTKSLYEEGDKVLVSYSKDFDGNEIFYVTDHVRKGGLYFLTIVFLAVILFIGRWRGFRAILGLVLSFFVIIKFIIPKILDGGDPLTVSLIYSFIIILAATYLVYGFNKKSSVSILGMSASIVITGILSIVFTKLCHLTGFAQEETMYIMNLTQGAINLQGLLLAGFIIGAIGVLDDLTISQVSTVQELHKLNPELSKLEMYTRAMRVGIDHVSSMVNTLFLAYVGVSLPLLLLFTFKQPPFMTFGQVINHEIIATEIVRTLVGSIGLALAVPITTFLAAYFYCRVKTKEISK
jgi:uncharacterized membrane protein